MSESSGKSLPNETLESIFDELDSTALSTVARVSTHYNAVAERILYSSINIKDVLSSASPMPMRTFHCCQSILRRPHLVETIKKLHVRWQTDSESPPSHYHLAPATAKLADALRSLSFLISLDLFLGPVNVVATPESGPLHAIERIIYGCHLSQLQYCALGAEWSKNGPQYTNILRAFLVTLPELQQLRLVDHRSALVVPETALPKLSIFRGSSETAASLLPGRPVQTLHLIGQDSDINRENLPRFTNTSLPIRFLDLSGMSIRPVLLRNIAEYLPTIFRLRIRLALRHTLHFALAGTRLLTGLSSVLSSFHHLSHLDLSPTAIAGFVQSTAEEELALTGDWGRACPSLTHIVFLSHRMWVLDSVTEVWAIAQPSSV
ncbi:hypothetical protein C8J56DRAFT_205364 [Mycena floridula]|nr:hypothetical protein C8J56DRAFT_205364 [Mycena floridula]